MKNILAFALLFLTVEVHAQLRTPADLSNAFLTMAPDSAEERTAGSLLIESAKTRKAGLFILAGTGVVGGLMASSTNTQTSGLGVALIGLGGVGWLVLELDAVGTQRRAGRIMKKKGI
jgi:hypothetical protein